MFFFSTYHLLKLDIKDKIKLLKLEDQLNEKYFRDNNVK